MMYINMIVHYQYVCYGLDLHRNGRLWFDL